MSDLRLPDHIANFFDEGREWHGVAEIRGWDEQKPAPPSSIEPTDSATNVVDTQVTQPSPERSREVRSRCGCDSRSIRKPGSRV
jgi:hypothetical protein